MDYKICEINELTKKMNALSQQKILFEEMKYYKDLTSDGSGRTLPLSGLSGSQFIEIKDIILNKLEKFSKDCDIEMIEICKERITSKKDSI